MTDYPVFDVHGDTEKDLERLQWLRDIFEATDRNVSEADEPAHEVCYWPGAIEKIDHKDEIMTVYWSDGVSIGCYGWAFNEAWSDLGDDTPVVFVATDDIDDAERASAELGD